MIIVGFLVSSKQACMPAANLALEDVNRENNLLPGFTLNLYSNDSEVWSEIRNIKIEYITRTVQQ